MRGTAVLALPPVMVVALLLLPHVALGAGAVGGGGGEGGCERRCGRMKLPYPFGFSSGCTIQLGCDDDDTDDVAWLGHARELGLFVRNVTARAITVGLSPDCSRQFNSSVAALFSGNHAPCAWNTLLVRSCSPAAQDQDANIKSCKVPPEYYGRWSHSHCSADESFSCIVQRPSNTSGRHFLNRNELLRFECTELVSSIIRYVDASEPQLAVLLDELELDWWVQGQCRCSSHANCTAFTAPTTGQQAFRCECREGFEGDGFIDGIGCLGLGGSKKARKKIYIIASTLSILAICLPSACLLGYKVYRSRKRSKETPRIESFLQKNAGVYPKRYTYAQVKKMTGTFAEKLGQGGFGVVYRGGLSSGRQIAVKMLKNSKSDVEEFINEVASISTTSHVNVVTLLGFCFEGSKRALIYDYMPNGSLERYAFKHSSKGEHILSWEKLFDIAVGIARGLEYLHRGCNTRIVHFDIKPHNILLDQDFCPKISDFGMAKLCQNKESVVSIGGARGTIGYIAPEVYSKQFGAVSSKSDVYSYGMMVLEMVGARDKRINANSECSSQYFPQWIYENLDEYCFGASEINGEIKEIARKMIVVGLWCIQLSASNRPTMTRVVEMLEGSTGSLELPPQVLLS
ncbi:unnamed protein product [Triticum turgidum subsp. durum]|uniref:Protein kinase domain-containing protein n=1 Tax=Triticum turgidum subsp. durum TaxID=4567 RepID=A0A9R0TIN9_TRITD|nr:unnamed protein product [Triticum turgidum subsp. durum]